MDENFFGTLGETENDNILKRNFDYYSDDELDDYWAHYFDNSIEEELEF